MFVANSQFRFAFLSKIFLLCVQQLFRIRNFFFCLFVTKFLGKNKNVTIHGTVPQWRGFDGTFLNSSDERTPSLEIKRQRGTASFRHRTGSSVVRAALNSKRWSGVRSLSALSPRFLAATKRYLPSETCLFFSFFHSLFLFLGNNTLIIRLIYCELPGCILVEKQFVCFLVFDRFEFL